MGNRRGRLNNRADRCPSAFTQHFTSTGLEIKPLKITPGSWSTVSSGLCAPCVARGRRTRREANGLKTMILQRQVTLQKAVRFYRTVAVIERRPGVMTAQPGEESGERAKGEFILWLSPRTKDNDSKCNPKKKEESRNVRPLTQLFFMLIQSCLPSIQCHCEPSFENQWLLQVSRAEFASPSHYMGRVEL